MGIVCTMIIVTATAGYAQQPTVAAESLARIDVFPARVALTGSRRQMHLVVTGVAVDGRLVDVTRQAAFAPSNPQVVSVADGIARPVADGTAEIVVRVGSLSATVPVEVSRAKLPDAVSFRLDTLPALTKQACNSGACHGSPSGKGGFRLSLRGFDPEFDETTLLREAFARRVNISDPEASLLLRKPTMQIAHGGGRRMKTNDPTFRVLHDWIAQGCWTDPTPALACVRLEVFPPVRILRHPAESQQLVALAHLSDGTTRDVTELADFTSTDETVATVTPAGGVQALGRGEAAIVVRYLDQIAISSLTFLRDVDGFRWPDLSERNSVDQLVFKKLKLLQIAPSEVCSDPEFLRRVHLDVIGVLPTAAEVQAFLADGSRDNRDRLIDSLLARDEFAEFWALRWGDLFQAKGSRMSSSGVHKFHHWLVAAVRDNMPYDRFARELLTARGSTFENPAANFFRTATDPIACSEVTSQLFLGVRIQCAKCHNHPYERWTQDHYYGLGAFFSRVQRKEFSNRGEPDELVVLLGSQGEVTQPRTGRTMKPVLPIGGEVDVPASVDRRDVFVRWLTAPDNPFFARVAVNRIWGHLFGKGIVDPVDDFRDSNPPSHAELLDTLAADFVRTGFNQRHILQTILRSTTYQLSSRETVLNKGDQKYFSHALARPLTAEQLLDAICHVTGVPEKFAGLPVGIRATALPTPDVGSDFLVAFGQPARNTACECERTDEPKLSQALRLLSGEIISKKLRSPGSRLSRLLNDTRDRVQAAGQPPAAGLQLWLRADVGAIDRHGAAVSDGDVVAGWIDQSSSKRNVEQSDANRRPAFVAAGLNGLPAIRFDGVDDLLHNSAVDLVPSGAARTMIVVGRVPDTGRGGAMFTFRRSTAGGGTVFSTQHGSVAGSYYVYSDGVNGGGNSTLPLETINGIRSPFATVFTSRGEGQKLEVWLNGEKQPVSQPGAVGPDRGATGFTIGNREDYAGFGWDGDLSEILVYDRALSPDELLAAGSYVATKYDLIANYPKRLVAASAEASQSDRAVVAELYLTALSRPPRADELEAAVTYVTESGNRRQGLEDLFWAVLNSKEFVFQH
jgi:hypothetical protein